ncbi:DUF4153 domain-containing protein [Pseudomonas fontis]|uniref:DUF4153 domain-containing protein n=1 Tax=Pseudomonas fontis TaxID=2942633 RepID=A0ABT5NRT9_9PSED|nr:DUF4153 domain-containing protein [Pseudomonas fontis]MDD0973598.1 DUF4153 domain-containing protein [Pseudomonas fontis]MDD0990895.1 DUF4153 domain-containing protein [Pseudomonas fontis]
MPALNRSLPLYLAIGLVQGLVLLGLSLLDIPLLTVAVGSVVLVGGTLLQLLGTAVKVRGTWVLVLGLTVLIAAISSTRYLGDAYDWLWLSWMVGAPLLAYICTAFIHSWPTREGARPRYQDLFQHAWNNVFIVLLAGLLCGLFMLLLWLCAGLFKMLHIEVVAELVRATSFQLLTLPVVFSLGMRMGCQNDKVIGLLRGILLTLCRFLLPISALTAVLFSAALALTGVQPIWDTGYSTTILLCLIGVQLFLVNGVFQDGEQQDYPRVLRRLVEASLLCLPVLAGLAAYSTWLRIDQYGLTPSRALGALLVAVALVYSLAAVWAVLFSRSRWLGALRSSNPPLALLCALLIVAFHSPVLDPVGQSARNQVERLLSGRIPVAQFDARALRNSLGKAGREQFEALAVQLERGEILDESGRAQLREQMAEAAPYAESSGPKLEWLGPAELGSEQFLAMADAKIQCGTPGCVLWPVDLDGDGRHEVMMLARHRYTNSATFYVRDTDDRWREGGTLYGIADARLMIQRIRDGAVQPVTPHYKTLQVDGVELSVRQSRQ